MLNTIRLYAHIGYKLLRGEVVDNWDYRNEYDKVADTYDAWLNEMGKFTNRIIKLGHIKKRNNIKILDFACGTGHITKKILEEDIDCEITCIDFSEKMLENLKKYENNKIKLIHGDGLKYLENCKEQYDMIYFGWALSYFDHKKLFKLFKKVLKKDGYIGIITNTRGTLLGIEEIFLKVMSENQAEITKPMEIKFNLPKGKVGLIKWFKNYGFEMVEIDEGEVVFKFDEAQKLLEWLNKTGASAGTRKIFRDYEDITPKLINEIKNQKFKDGKYEINHKFAYGIFKNK